MHLFQAWKKTSSYRIKRFYAQELTKYHDLCPDDCPVWQAKFYDSFGIGQKYLEKLDYMHDIRCGGLAATFRLDMEFARF